MMMDDYAINRVLKSIKFEGDGEHFVNDIKKTVPNVLNQHWGGNPLEDIGNEVTAISIDNVNVSVRDAVSNGINLHGYNRLIWTAFTSLDTHQTVVNFRGPIIDMEKYKLKGTSQ